MKRRRYHTSRSAPSPRGAPPPRRAPWALPEALPAAPAKAPTAGHPAGFPMALLVATFAAAFAAAVFLAGCGPPRPAYPGLRAVPQTIRIDKGSNTLFLYRWGFLARTYVVGTGRRPDLTPEGTFRVVAKVKDPAGPGPGPSPFGTRWMGLDVPGREDGMTYGIHGTDDPRSIGGHVSSGCIRMFNRDAEELFDRVLLGTPVVITP